MARDDVGHPRVAAFVAAALLSLAVSWSAEAQPDPVIAAQQALAKCESAFTACAKACVAATCQTCEDIRKTCRAEVYANVTPGGKGKSSGTGTSTPGTGTTTPGTGTPAPGTGTPTPGGSATPPKPCLPDGTCKDQCKECKSGKCVAIPAKPFAKSKVKLRKIKAPTRASSKQEWADPTNWGYADVEQIQPTIEVRCDKGVWRAVLTGITGEYTVLARLLKGRLEVTGVPPKGNTTKANFCNQVTDLKSLFGKQWYMLRAVQAHEAVHASHMHPALLAAAADIEALFTNLTIPIVPGMSRADALKQIKASPAFAAAREKAYRKWLQQYDAILLPDQDHAGGAGPAYQAERNVVQPMIVSICKHAKANAWPACPTCPP